MDKKCVFIRSLSYIEPVIAIAMRRTLFTVMLFLIGAILNAQTVNELIKLEQVSQQKFWAIKEGAVDFRLTSDATYYYLRLTLPDIKQFELNDGKSSDLTSTRRGNSKESLIRP